MDALAHDLKSSIDSLIQELDTIINDGFSNWSEVHWIETEEGDTGESFCSECAENERQSLCATLCNGGYTDIQIAEMVRVSCSSAYESDRTECCSSCGSPLIYTLTDYGLKGEITEWVNVYINHRENIHHPMSASNAYNLKLILEHLSNHQTADVNDAAENLTNRLMLVDLVKFSLNPNAYIPPVVNKSRVRL